MDTNYIHEDASVALVRDHNASRPTHYGIIVPEAQAREYLELALSAQRHKARRTLETIINTALVVLSFVLGFTLAMALL